MVDKKQAVVTALRGLATSFSELSKAHRAAQSAITAYSEELEHTENPQALLQNFPALFGNLETYGAPAPATSSKAKPASKSKAIAAVTGGEDGVDGEDQKRKRGPNKEKKIKDPNAPKRPASAYIEYQNAVREDFRTRHSDLQYADVLKKIGESWAALTDDQKKPYHDIMENKKTLYLSDKKAYEAEHGPPQTVPAGESPEPKEYTGKKRGRKSNAERALMAAAAATDAGRAAVQASSSKQADIPVNAPSKKIVEESDDDSDEDSDDSSSSSDDSSDESSEEEPTPPPVVVPPPKKEKKSKSDKHKSKKSKSG